MSINADLPLCLQALQLIFNLFFSLFEGKAKHALVFVFFLSALKVRLSTVFRICF